MKAICITLAAAAVLAACTTRETRSTAEVVPPAAVVTTPPAVVVSPPPAVVSPAPAQTVTVTYTGPNGFDLAQQRADAYCRDRFSGGSARLMSDNRTGGQATFECVVGG